MITFRGSLYELVLTNHARMRMFMRGIDDELLRKVIETGIDKKKPQRVGGYWVFLNVRGRGDNLICVSLVIESKTVVIKTVLVNWRPE